MKKIKAVLCVFILALLMTSSTKTTTIFVIGDSTAAEKGGFRNNPERGWGMVLQGFFDDKVIVDNHAVNGRSSLSFINEGIRKLTTIAEGKGEAGTFFTGFVYGFPV